MLNITTTRFRLASAFCAGLLTLTVPSSAQVTYFQGAVEIRSWVTAVRQHEPGVPDASLATLRTLNLDAPQSAKALNTFLNLLVSSTPSVVSSSEEKDLGAISRDVKRVSADAFLERAAVLHADAAIVFESGSMAPSRLPGSLVIIVDGQTTATMDANPNWRLARRLLDLVGSKSRDRFIPLWYHATTAYMLANRVWAEAGPHLDHAASLYPDDTKLLFDRAGLAESLALPGIQVLLSDEDRLSLRLKQEPNAVVHPNLPRTSATADAMAIPLPDKSNAEAERIFRRVVQIDPTFVEAQARLARLLLVRGRAREAHDAATHALKVKPPDSNSIVAYFAELFAARADRLLGRLDEATAHIHEALKLFPNAQTALLFDSELSVLKADAEGTVGDVRRLSELPIEAEKRTDPWWIYDIGMGRNASALLNELWQATRALQQ